MQHRTRLALILPVLSFAAFSSTRVLQREPLQVVESTPTTEHAPQSWNEVAARAEDTLIGSGFDVEQATRHYSGFDASGHFRPDLGDAALNPLAKQLAAEQIEDLYAIADSFDALIHPRAVAVVDAIRVELAQEIDSGEWFHAPVGSAALEKELADREATKRRADFTYTDSFSIDGWYVSVMLDSRSDLEFGRAMSALVALEHDRFHALADYIENLP